MKTALFTNFSTEPFIGYWNGKGKKFEPGQSVYMPDYLAKHFAKHLANRELLKKGFDKDTSPKVKVRANGDEYVDNENFLEVFNQAYIPDTDEEFSAEKDNIDVQIEVANKNRRERGGETMPTDINPPPTARQEQSEQEKVDPTQPQVIIPPDYNDSDEDEFPNNPNKI